MELSEARDLLGVPAGVSAAALRAAYHRRIRVTHPDVAGPSGTQLAVRINEAYALLSRAPETPAPPPPPPPTAAERDVDEGAAVRLVSDDTIRLAMPADEAFARLIDAAHRIGEVTYVDGSSAIFEAVVVLSDGQSYSLVVSLQGRADGTDAFCTLEALEHVGPEPVALVAATLAAEVR